jgi:Phage portal protein, lambda family
MAELVDQYGRAIRASALFKSPISRPQDFKRITPPRPKTFEAVLAWQRREMVDVSRVIAAGVPTIDDALTQAGEFSVGDSWHIKSRGTNKAWGKKRDAWFNQTYARDCNLRGTQNDWWSSLRQLNWTRKVQGDYGIIFDGQPYKTSDGKEIPPSGKFHVITYDRIGTGINVACSVGGGLDKVNELGNNYLTSTYPTLMVGFYGMYVINDKNSIFDGKRIIDGVIVDANMRTLGYRVNGFNATGRAVYVDIPKEQMHINFSARKMADMVRGFPEIAEQILPVLHLDDIQDLISMSVKLASAMAITRKSSDGNPARSGRAVFEETGVDTSGNPVSTKRAVEEIFPGIIELATNNKEELSALGFDRPSMNEEAFVERIETAVLHKLWPRALIYGGDAGRAGIRSLAVQARTICRWDQRCMERSAIWIANRATEFAMREGVIPQNNNLGDAYEYGFTVPSEFTVDEGNDSKMRLMALGRGVISRGKITELDGYMAEEIEEEREVEEDRIMSAAERLSQKHNWISPKEAMLRLDSGDSNVSYSDSAQEKVVDNTNDDIGPDGEPLPGKQPKTKPNKPND